jgi:hypothetical protein
METTGFSSTLLTTYQFAQCHIPEVMIFAFTAVIGKATACFYLIFPLYFTYSPFYVTHRSGLCLHETALMSSNLGLFVFKLE